MICLLFPNINAIKRRKSERGSECVGERERERERKERGRGAERGRQGASVVTYGSDHQDLDQLIVLRDRHADRELSSFKRTN